MPLRERTYVVILAGGIGKRFVPYSTPERPKQFLPITHPTRTMLEQTYERALLVSKNFLISTNERHVPLVREQISGIDSADIIGEPLMKNTAPAVAYAAKAVASRDKDAVMVVMPSDHFVENRKVFAECIDKAISTADASGLLVTLGIVPTCPSTDYGYIMRGGKKSGDGYPVERFVEKPDRKTAERYIKEGVYYWNSGMFVWRVDAFMHELKKHTPEIAALLGKPGVSAREFFEAAPSISIDYALMEKSDKIAMFELDAGWSDVGSWDVVAGLVREGKIEPPAAILPYLRRGER